MSLSEALKAALQKKNTSKVVEGKSTTNIGVGKSQVSNAKPTKRSTSRGR